MHIIASFDGGGIRGLFTARLLQRLDQVVPDFLKQVDLFAGTSTGGIIALALASGWTPEKIVDWYWTRADMIFPKNFWTQIEETTEPKYSGVGLTMALEDAFGQTKLADLKRNVAITTYDCSLRSPFVMTRNTDVTVVNAARRTSAAPVYFPPAEGRYIDGGMAANDPSLLAFCKAPSGSVVLSVGTGNASRPPFSPGNWGAIPWLRNGLIDLVFECPAEATIFAMRRILGGNYFRLDGRVDCALDDTVDLNRRLIEPADALPLDRAIQWVRGILSA